MPYMTSEYSTVETVDLAIIGAGWYGLSAAKTFLRLRPSANVMIIDNDSTVGGVWSKQRLYPNLVAQVKIGLFNYTDAKMPPDTVHRDDRVSGEMVHNYMQRYAEDHDLIRRIRFNTFVENASRCEKGWKLTLRGSTDTVEAAKLMVCTGVTSIPSMPDWCQIQGVSVPMIHSRDLGVNFEALRSSAIQKVVVIGAAKSAYDAVYLLLSLGKEVVWIIRKEGAGPLAILPSKVLGLVSSIAVASTRLMTHLSPSILNTKGSWYWTLQRSFLGLWAVGKFWDTLAWISDMHAGYNEGDHVAELRPEIERQSIFWANSGLGVVTMPNFWSTMHSPKLQVVRDRVTLLEADTITLQSGSAMKVDSIVLCTGWGDHFGMFDDAMKAELGLPIWGSPPPATKAQPGDIAWQKYDLAADKAVNEKLPFLARPPKLEVPLVDVGRTQKRWRLYRRSIPIGPALNGDRSIAIMGQIHTVQTPLVADVQCFWTILYLLGELDLPDADTMASEIAEWNAWTRKRYLSQGLKFPYSLYDFLPYIDTLFEDLGLESFRKSNGVREMFEPYKPEDFNGFIDEYLAARAQRSQ